MARKLSEIQERVETQPNEARKVIQDLKDNIVILRKNRLLELKILMQKFQKTVWSLKNRLDEAEERISELRDQSVESTQSKINKKEF